MKNKYCKCCFEQFKTDNVFCDDCIEEGVSSFGRDVDISTGEIVMAPKPTTLDLVEYDEVCGKDCPWTGDSYGVDMGCLPSPWDAVRKFNKTGKVYVCHSNEKIACTGLKKCLNKNGIDTRGRPLETH